MNPGENVCSSRLPTTRITDSLQTLFLFFFLSPVAHHPMVVLRNKPRDLRTRKRSPLEILFREKNCTNVTELRSSKRAVSIHYRIIRLMVSRHKYVFRLSSPFIFFFRRRFQLQSLIERHHSFHRTLY